MFGFFRKRVEKEEFEDLKRGVQTAFERSKQDIQNLGVWVTHLDEADSSFKDDIMDIKENLSTVKDELEQLKNMIDLVGNKGSFAQRQTVFNKQTAVGGVLNSVQTAVQTPFLRQLSPSERALVVILLNQDMKLSYEDLGALLGKSKATVRGQVNSIRQKSEGLIAEMISENNKKRVYIPDSVRDLLLKKGKVRVHEKKKRQKSREEAIYS